MIRNRAHGTAAGRKVWRTSGFTLVELLVVIAIIVLLIGLLAPGLAGAREQARKAKVRATLKGIGDGLDLFRSENESEFNGYPPSAVAEDETESGAQEMWGAGWLVHYLMGKDLNGYVPRRSVPTNMFGQTPWAEKDWYSAAPADNNGKPLQRVGPYVPREGIKVKQLSQLPGNPSPAAPELTEQQKRQLVFVDEFGYPILYYRADPRQAAKANAPIARYSREEPGAIYTFEDNVIFTGNCAGGLCKYDGWDFGGGSKHVIEDFGPEKTPDTTKLVDYPFVYYILDRNAYDATYDSNNPDALRTAIPYRRDSFILISAGKDMLYGTADDVTNF